MSLSPATGSTSEKILTILGVLLVVAIIGVGVMAVLSNTTVSYGASMKDVKTKTHKIPRGGEEVETRIFDMSLEVIPVENTYWEDLSGETRTIVVKGVVDLRERVQMVSADLTIDFGVENIGEIEYSAIAFDSVGGFGPRAVALSLDEEKSDFHFIHNFVGSPSEKVMTFTAEIPKDLEIDPIYKFHVVATLAFKASEEEDEENKVLGTPGNIIKPVQVEETIILPMGKRGGESGGPS